MKENIDIDKVFKLSIFVIDALSMSIAASHLRIV
jgi:hypothetical protein